MCRCFGLPAVDISYISEFFADTFVKTATPELSEYIKYLQSEFMKPSSTFPPTLWAGIAEKNITNGCESYHRHFGDIFPSPKPNIYDFLKNLADFLVFSSIKSHSVKAADAILERIRGKYRELQLNVINTMEFVSLVSLGLQPVSKLKKTYDGENVRGLH